MKVPLYRHNLTGHDIDALGEEFKQILSGMHISTGEVCAEVEKMISDYLNTDYTILTNNWTNAMTATLLAMGIGPGDEVIVPAMTFVATPNAVEAVGATPVLVDVKFDTGLMDITAAARACTSKTKCIIPVHLYGNMVDVQGLREMMPPNIRIIEDAAHAFEASHPEFFGSYMDSLQGFYNVDNHYRPGRFSDAACFSFYASKNLTTGEGGAVTTNDYELYQKIKKIYRHGIDLTGRERYDTDSLHIPDAVEVGRKGNMPDLLAFLLKPQLKNIKNSVTARRAIHDYYSFNFDDMTAIDPIPGFSRGKSAHHASVWAMSSAIRDEVAFTLNQYGISTAVQFRPVHETTYYSKKYNYSPMDFPNAHHLGRSIISLPIFASMTNDEMAYVAGTMTYILTELVPKYRP